MTVLGNIVRQHPELVREVDFKDGKHKLLNIDVFARQQQDQYGNIATIKASCKKAEQKQGLNYYLSNLKKSAYQNDGQQQQQQAQTPPPAANEEPLPF